MAYKPTTTGTPIERLVGCMALTTLSACYYYSALWLPVALCWYFWVSKVVGVFLLVLYFLSVALPPVRCPRLLSTWFYKCALKLHDFEEVRETSDEEIEAIEKEKKIIYAITPHGVMSISGICAAINMAPRPTPPTCAAGIIQRVPILKHVFGTFGIIGASSRTITKTLLTSSVILYVGGIAELFMSSPVEERLFVGKRKGFIKLAMITGSDVIPCYYFGNTVALEIIRNSFLKSVSRKLGVSITLLWGRWGLPVPMPCKVLCVMGKPIGIPKKEFPSEDDINKYHSLYLKEVKRLFDTYKTRLPDYKDKELIIET